MNLLNKIIKTTMVSSLVTLSAFASNVIIEPLKVETITLEAWEKAKEFEITLYPQTTVKFNDKKANELNKDLKTKTAYIKALQTNSEISFKVVWEDKTKTIQKGVANRQNSFADGFAIQFASNYEDATKLPYIGMGSKNRPVVVYLQKAVEQHFEPNGKEEISTQVNRNNTYAFNDSLKQFDKKVEALAIKDYQRAFISEGFRSMTQIKDNSTFFNAKMQYKENFFSSNIWEGEITRVLKDEYLKISSKPFPIAIAIWDGEKMQRDGLKHLSSWITVSTNQQEATKYQQSMDSSLLNADIKNGENLVKTNCASCHNYKDENNANKYMAPNLSNIGGYSTTSYLQESILEPSAVVVPGYNRNAHKNYEWYYLDGKNRVSTMPSFSYLSNKEIEDMVAYLKTLKVQGE
ncbi:hypothetical protein CRU99_08130 [Malaciobacter mytili]|uniref:ethylbenzene dehydrogenase-related protein n=1 Tax=Malaciobacter mytili TaxID=603050 RepID=UPI00100BEAF1|nr:ethylbenzene dehydrogenase-related protein [Malaciobacter mytili]RXI43318.1 hypothetical protein CRU99_08130 [Malaciobacter mytili]